MKPLFEVRDVDRTFYVERVRDFIPDRIMDIHTHVWLKKFTAADREEPKRRVTWPGRVAGENSIEDLIETYRLIFPGKEITPLIFGNMLSPSDDAEGGNAYVGRSAAANRFPALIFALPHWSGKELEEKILAGGFVGAKVYLSLSAPCLSENEIRIFDFLPHHQLEALNRRCWIVILHIPRAGRLKDPVNLEQMLEIEARYPNVKLVIAHVGRAYCPEDVGNAFDVLAQTKRMLFDISANTNAYVFRQLIEAVGPKRILFGSDLPVTRMRMRRVCEDGNYVNLVPKGLYGDVSDDKHMRDVEGEEAGRLSFFVYEVIDAFRRAAEATRLTRADVENVFHHNAAGLIETAGQNIRPQLQMVWPKERLGVPPPWSMPDAYILRTYREGDDNDYKCLMDRAGFRNWSDADVKNALGKCLPNGLYFAVHRGTGTLAATAAATHNPIQGHPFGGELGWVAGDPDHRGHGLGRIVCAAATKRLLDAGYTDVYLRTDDFRLPAIKTYLNIGWVPLFFAPDMNSRWQTVLSQLNMCGREAAAVRGMRKRRHPDLASGRTPKEMQS